MKHFACTLALVIMFVTGAEAQTTETIPCLVLPVGAESAVRSRLETGGYGFCTILTCKPDHELISGKCHVTATEQAPPSSTWFSKDQMVQEAAVEVVVRAILKVAYPRPISISVSTTGSAVSGVDYNLLTAKADFPAGSRLSNPIKIQIIPRTGHQGDRAIQLGLQGSPSSLLSVSILEATPLVTNQLTLTAPVEVIEGQSIDLSFALSSPISRIAATRVSIGLSGDISAVGGVTNISASIPSKTTQHVIAIPTVSTSGVAGTRTLTLRIKNPIKSTETLTRVVTVKPENVFTYLAQFSEYENNNVSAICSGTQVATRTKTCIREQDQVVVDNSLCPEVDPSPTTTYMSPAGSQIVNIDNGQEEYFCSEGSDELQLTQRTCNSPQFFNNGTICAPETFSQVFSSYANPLINVSQACQGSEETNRTMTCHADGADLTVDQSYCEVDPAPTMIHQSVEGTYEVAVTGGTETRFCAVGATANESTFVSRSCNTESHFDNGSACAPLEYVATYSPYTTLQVCAGAGQVTRTLDSCKIKGTETEVDDAFCGTDQYASIIDESPEGQITENIANGTEVNSCEAGSSTKTLVSRTCVEGYGDYGSGCGKELLFFAATDGVNSQEPWVSDGTDAGTFMLADIAPASLSSSAANFMHFDGRAYFSATNATYGTELWVSDGTTAGTKLFKDIVVGSGSSSAWPLGVFKNKLYFSATDGTNGVELWVTDGTSNGTSMVKDVNPGATGGVASASSAPFIVTSDRFYFRGDDGINGMEIWTSDGTEAGTKMVKNIHPSGSGGFSTATRFGEKIIFTANDGSLGPELWVSDGTELGTSIVKDLSGGATGSSPSNYIAFNGKVYFSASDIYGSELYATDGTAQGTDIVKDINPVGSSSPAHFVNAGNKLMFMASDGTTGGELWSTDGTSAGTVQVKDILPGSTGSNPQYMTMYKGQTYFRAGFPSFGEELAVSDGTGNGTLMLKDIAAGLNRSQIANSQGHGFTVSGGKLFFTANNLTNGIELWKTNGTPGGTVMVKDINPTGASSVSASLSKVHVNIPIK